MSARTKQTFVLGAVALAGCMTVAAQVPSSVSPPSVPKAAPSAATERALLDQYCVTCHNDKAKTANLSLQNLDLATAGDHPEVWERVVRKLRAGLMPPPGVRRPPLPQYEGLRDWLEAEIDRKAAARPNPGSVVLHRLNRTEYANVVRDLLDLDIDVATLLARMSIGFWKTPTEQAYIAPGDTSQNVHIEGLPFGTRGGMLVRHVFPADGEYKFEVQNFGL